jgi:hypothetical protein
MAIRIPKDSILLAVSRLCCKSDLKIASVLVRFQRIQSHLNNRYIKKIVIEIRIYSG